jgi:tRNA 2-thiouridine synthesizing protein E
MSQTFEVIAGRKVLFDGEGFLWNAEDWDEDVADFLSVACGIEMLSDAQWRVIRFMRDYFLYHGRAPLNRDLKAAIGMSLLELEALFPGGIRGGARRLAGLPNPKTCAG